MRTLFNGIVLAIIFCCRAGDGLATSQKTVGPGGTALTIAPDLPIGAVETGRRYGLAWANGRFVYAFSPEVRQDSVKVVAFEAACHRLLQNTSLRCVPRAQALSDRDYVYVIDGGRDFSFVGRQGGKQLLSILIWNNPIVISHEIKHALGWGHEQQHPERDHYVDILFANIPLQSRENFAVFDNGNEGPYDFDSIMHYSPADFAIAGRKAIRAKPAFKNAQGMMGQRDHLSVTDLQEIREFYGGPSVQWCGISRKPTAVLPSGCGYVCHFGADPSVGAWMAEGTCKPAVPEARAGG